MILDALNDAEARAQLSVCCGASRWVERMMAARPFGTADRARDTADAIWNGLSPQDWREAFDHHPRIGENRSASPQSAVAASLSANEQSRVTAANDTVKRELTHANAEYERRFGYIYIVCAAGKSADELLSICRSRLANDPDTELRVAAEEQRKIMQLRLAKLLEAR